MSFNGKGRALAASLAEFSTDPVLSAHLAEGMIEAFDDLLSAVDGRPSSEVVRVLNTWFSLAGNFRWGGPDLYSAGVTHFVNTAYVQNVTPFKFACANCGGCRYKCNREGVYWTYRLPEGFAPHTVEEGYTKGIPEDGFGPFVCTHCDTFRGDLVRLTLKTV